MVEEVKKTKSIDTMHTLKKAVEDMEGKVNQCEALVNKLENEIIEWDALKKLCRRDEELAEIDTLLGEFGAELGTERADMQKHLDKYEKKIEEDPKDQEATGICDEINDYMDDLEKLARDVNYLKEEKDEIFEEFDEEIPSPVKIVRNKRNANKGGKKNKPCNTDSDKPTDMYYMMAVNCQFRKPIHEMLKKLRAINQRRRDLEEKWADLKARLNKVVEKVWKGYKAIKGDAIDELWAYHINKAMLDLPVVRIAVGKYLFGTRNITCKIINGKLVVRVGGGYMSADEFIAQYGKVEVAKMQHNEDVMAKFAEDQKNAGANGGSPDGRRGSGVYGAVARPSLVG